jgi:hypothetical protein
LPLEEQPQEQPKYPEVALTIVVPLLRERFSVLCENVFGRPYYVRFKMLETGQSVQGFAHNKGTTLSPLFIKQILERFEIPLPDFLEAVASFKKK